MGFGKAGAGIHAPLIAATPGLRVTHIVTNAPERRAAAAQQCPAAQVVANADDLWALGEQFDSVVIASPHPQHVPTALAAVRHGFPTVVDKPLGRTWAEAAPLVELAERTGVPLTVFHNRRWDTDFLSARRAIETGLLGDVVRWESRFERWRPVVVGGWRDNAPEHGGGLLLDLMTHLVDQAIVVLGPVSSVNAELGQLRPTAAAEDDVLLALTHESGAKSTLWAGVLAAAPGPRFRVLGTRGSLIKVALDWQEDALKVSGSAAALTEPAPKGEGGLFYDGSAPTPVVAAGGSWLEFYRLWQQTLTAGAPVPVRPGDALAVLRVTDAARRASAERQVIVLPEDHQTG